MACKCWWASGPQQKTGISKWSRVSYRPSRETTVISLLSRKQTTLSQYSTQTHSSFGNTDGLRHEIIGMKIPFEFELTNTDVLGFSLLLKADRDISIPIKF